MNDNNFAVNIQKDIEQEIEKAENFIQENDLTNAFRHLERAHVLGQSITMEHTKIHWLMLKIGWRKGDFREIFGQIVRIVGAATKTPFGIFPKGNTGGANVWFFKPMPVPPDLQKIISRAENINRK